MNVFTRVSATLKAGVERSVARIENHEAIVDASLERSRQSAAKARVRLTRQKKDGDALRKQMEALGTEIEQWTRRARSLADSDSSRALECLQRRKVAQAALAECQRSIDIHRQAETELESTVATLETRLAELHRQHNHFRSREATVDASRAIAQLDGNGVQCVEDSFERWEETLLSQEMAATSETRYASSGSMSGRSAGNHYAAHSQDTLSNDFEREELHQTLMAELDELRSDGGDGRKSND